MGPKRVSKSECRRIHPQSPQAWMLSSDTKTNKKGSSENTCNDDVLQVSKKKMSEGEHVFLPDSVTPTPEYLSPSKAQTGESSYRNVYKMAMCVALCKGF